MSKHGSTISITRSSRWIMAAVMAAGLSVAAAGQSARATVVSYGAVNPAGTGLAAYAVFNVGTSSISVTVNNYSPATTSDVQEIYGIDFTVFGANGSPVTFTSGPSVTGAVGTEITITQASKGGDYVISSTKAINSPTDLSKPWIVSTNGTGELSLTVDTSKPNDMIIAPPPQPNNYGSNNGLHSTAEFNPQLESGATFTLDVGGLSSGDTIGNVTLLYGTSPTSTSTVPFINGTPTPEPSVLAFLGMGAVGSLMFLRKKH
jgi:hypothetical protein